MRCHDAEIGGGGKMSDERKLSTRLARMSDGMTSPEDMEAMERAAEDAAELEARAEKAERELVELRDKKDRWRRQAMYVERINSQEGKRAEGLERNNRFVHSLNKPLLEWVDELREKVEAWEYCARAWNVGADWWADEGGYHIWVNGPNGEPLQTLHAGSITELAAKVRAREEGRGAGENDES
jgi:hypothetical protein